MAAVFVQGGIDVLRNPGPRAQRIRPVTDSLPDALPLPGDPEQLVKLNAAVHVVFGGLLALNKLPRLSAAVLAASLVPTTVAGHRFWEEEDPQAKAMQRVHFMKNLAMLGGLIVAATDRRR
jgi:uncharacterized membrane protein YphA (DoxX/SURF4 family)